MLFGVFYSYLLVKSRDGGKQGKENNYGYKGNDARSPP